MTKLGGFRGALRGCAVGGAISLAAVGAASCGGNPAATTATTGAKTPTLTTVTLSLPAKVGGYLPFYLAIAKGFYASHGITLQIEIMHPNTAVQQVLAGKLDLVGGVTESDTAILKDNAPLKTFAVFDQRLDWVTVAPTSVTGVKALVGKTLAGEAADSTANVIEDEMLMAKGIQPSQVSFANVRGADSARMALVEGGKATATVVEYSEYLALPPGYHIIYNDSNFIGTYGGFAGRIDWAKAHRTALHNLIAATAEATHYILNDKKQTVKVIETTFTLTKSKAEKLWTFMRPDWAFGKPTAKAETANIAKDQVVLQLPTTPKVSQIATWKYVTHS